MKIALAVVALTSSSSAFVPSMGTRGATHLSSSTAVITGPTGQAAKSKEEDLRLTLQLILDHQERPTTTSKEQMLAQVEEAAKIVEEEPVDLTIPYDAAAQLAYSRSDQSMPYADFKIAYEEQAVVDVKAKRAPTEPATTSTPATVVDLSIPYDAAAQLAYENSDKSRSFADFKVAYEQQAVADVTAKRPVDLSVPYDAAAHLAFVQSDRSMPFAEFKELYLVQAVADVVAKRS